MLGRSSREGKQTISIRKGEYCITFLLSALSSLISIQGALDTWIPQLFAAVDNAHLPPPDITLQSMDSLPPPRIAIAEIDLPSASSSKPVHRYDDYQATVRVNKRITAPGWYQDVRHIEFELEEHVPYAL